MLRQPQVNALMIPLPSMRILWSLFGSTLNLIEGSWRVLVAAAALDVFCVKMGEAPPGLGRKSGGAAPG